MIRTALNRPRWFGTVQPPEDLVNWKFAPSDFSVSSAVVYSNFVSQEEGSSILEDVLERMKRYECCDEIENILFVQLTMDWVQSPLRKRALGRGYQRLQRNRAASGT